MKRKQLKSLQILTHGRYVVFTLTDQSADLKQSLPPIATKEPSPEHAVVVPDDAVSPLNLKANISSTSPSRARRPFRFSNSTDRPERVSPIGNTSFSWAAKSSDEEVRRCAIEFDCW